MNQKYFNKQWHHNELKNLWFKLIFVNSIDKFFLPVENLACEFLYLAHLQIDYTQL